MNLVDTMTKWEQELFFLVENLLPLEQQVLFYKTLYLRRVYSK